MQEVREHKEQEEVRTTDPEQYGRHAESYRQSVGSGRIEGMDNTKTDPRYLRTVYYLRSTTYGYAFSEEASEELYRNNHEESFSEEMWEDIWRELCADWEHDNPNL